MNSPRTATANYVLQHLLTVHTDALGAARPPELHQLSPAQANNHVPSALDSTLQLDALLVFHNALCLAQGAGQINATTRGDRLQLLQQSRIQPRRRGSPPC